VARLDASLAFWERLHLMFRSSIPAASILLVVLGCGSGPSRLGTGGAAGRGAAGGAAGGAGERGGAGGLAGGAAGSAGASGGGVAGSAGAASGFAGGVAGSAGGASGFAGGVAGSAGGFAGGPTGAELDWAGWPMPSDPFDVAAGASNPMAYTTNGDGTVTDLVTGLMWQQPVASTVYAWADAVAYCPPLSIGGHNDWRLPTEIELVSLINGFPRTPDPSIDLDAFTQTPADFFWSATPLAGSPGVAWFVLFDGGTVSASDARYPFHVRCVRSPGARAGAAPPARYALGAATVDDTKTKLAWQRSISTAMYGWQAARTYCPSPEVASALGGTGWRLPTMKELLTLVDFGVPIPGPTIDATAFPGAPAVSFWSATAVETSTMTAWRVAFDSGGATTMDVGSPLYVRCVR
jgi:hypothetical protein